MTFMLDDFDAAKVAPARGRDVQPTQFGEGLGASTSMMMRDTNANFLRQRQVIGERDTLAEQAAERLGASGMRPLVDAYNARVVENGLIGREIDIGMPMSEIAQKLGPNGSKAILDAARAAATTAPDAWGDLDLTEEGVEGRVTARRIADDADEQAILDMMPSGRTAAEFIGGAVGATADVRNAPFLLLGGGSGSFLKVLGREAVFGAVAEAVTLPSQYEVAEELGKAAPDPLAQIALGAVGGAVLGGGIEGIARAARYYQGRSAMPEPLPGLGGPDSEMIVGAAEAALVRGENPLRAVSDAAERLPEQPIRIPADPDVDAAWQAAVTSPRTMAEDAAPPTTLSEVVRTPAARSYAEGPFGPVFDDVEATPEAAIARLMEEKRGEVPAVVTREDIGPIALIHGNKKMGLAHIASKHPEMMPLLPDLLRTGEVVPNPDGLPRAFLLSRDEPANVVAVRLDWDGQDKAWVVTSFRDDWGKFARDQREAYRTDLTDARVPASSGQDQLRTTGDSVQGQPAAAAMSDTGSTEARLLHDTMAADMRDRIEANGDSSFDLGDGRGARSMTAILDDLDAAEEFNAVLDACGKPRRTE